jgi:5'-nucleotidase
VPAHRRVRIVTRLFDEGKKVSSIHGTPTGSTNSSKVDEAMRRAQAVLSDGRLGTIFSVSPGRDIPVARQIFVNRNLPLSKVELVGFDMDYTLAIYHQRRIEQLSYRLTAERLVSHGGYHPAVATLAYDHSSVIRGLFIDKKHGNLLKIDRFGHVGRASHGKRPMPEAEIERLYHNERIRLKNQEYAWIDTLFALPEAALFQDLVELYEQRLHQPLNTEKLFADVREAIDTVHRDNSLKAIIRADLGHYILKEPELGPALHKLRSGGKRLFVLTNSLWDYTDAVMSYLLDGVLAEYPSWRNYFDVVITGAAKPAFFSESRPFQEVDTAHSDNRLASTAVDALDRSKVYQGGNLLAFERLTGFGGESVLYVGDHIYGDILKSKKTSMWRTCMVVQEIEDEINYLETRRDEIDRLAHTERYQVRLDDEVQRHKVRLNQLEKKLSKTTDAAQTVSLEEEFALVKAQLDVLRRALKECQYVSKTLEADIDAGFNLAWGLHFKEGVENSRFGEQVEQYACLYTSRVSNFLAYSPVQLFRSAREQMPHEMAGALSAKLGTMGSEGPPKAANRANDIP